MTLKATRNLSWDEWLTTWWGKPKHERREPADLHFSGPSGPDRHLMYGLFCTKGYDERGNLTRPSLQEELEARGYDITTIEFRVKKKTP